MPIADRMTRRVADFAVIKNMFEEGRQLKERFGADNVYDFSLGNPDVPPPDSFRKALRELTQSEPSRSATPRWPGICRYAKRWRSG